MSVTDLDVLGLRELNRALLARQLLLERVPLGVVETVEHLVGMQAQAPFPPYYGLWSRLAGFRPEDLAALLTDRGVVRIALMRGTIHLVSARDCLPLRWLTQPVIDRMFRTNHGRRLPGVDLGELAAVGRELVESEPMTFGKLGEALAKRWPDHPPSDLAQGVRALVPLVQVPPRAVWGRSGQSLHTSAESWLGRPVATEPDLTELVIRYLAAFGPATVRDIQAWSGLTGLRGVVDALRPTLATFRSEGGAELFDLPDAPRPPGGTPAPVRLVAEFDNLVLSHADRTRIISEEDRSRLYTANGIFPGTVLIDGFVAGMWRLITERGVATLTIEVWEPETAAERDELITEGERLLAFAAPGDVHDIRFAPIATAAPRLPHPGTRGSARPGQAISFCNCGACPPARGRVGSGRCRHRAGCGGSRSCRSAGESPGQCGAWYQWPQPGRRQQQPFLSQRGRISGRISGRSRPRDGGSGTLGGTDRLRDPGQHRHP